MLCFSFLVLLSLASSQGRTENDGDDVAADSLVSPVLPAPPLSPAPRPRERAMTAKPLGRLEGSMGAVLAVSGREVLLINFCAPDVLPTRASESPRQLTNHSLLPLLLQKHTHTQPRYTASPPPASSSSSCSSAPTPPQPPSRPPRAPTTSLTCRNLRRPRPWSLRRAKARRSAAETARRGLR